MKKKYIYNIPAYLYPFVMGIFMLYLSLIATYLFHNTMFLKILDNLEHYSYRKRNILITTEDI
ncbi:hypothetical protein BU066_12625, partial [Staphylococcus succinus]